MTSYPDLVLQKKALNESGAVIWGLVDPDMWRYFGSLSDAEQGLGMIEGVMDSAQMFPSEVWGGIWSSFRYLNPNSDIHARLCLGTVKDEDGLLYILEGPSDINDRDKVPLYGVDKYTAGEAHVLKVRRITPGPSVGEMYWDAA